ncbi:MAG: hypothetical protein WKF81_11540, partial [Thermomicrobiales bacterium]
RQTSGRHTGLPLRDTADNAHPSRIVILTKEDSLGEAGIHCLSSRNITNPRLKHLIRETYVCLSTALARSCRKQK